MTVNPLKTESLLFSRKTYPPAHPNFYFNNTPIQEVSSHQHLGVVFSYNCSWHDHIDSIKKKAWKRINLMCSFKFTLDRKSLEFFYFSFIRPILTFEFHIISHSLPRIKVVIHVEMPKAAPKTPICHFQKLEMILKWNKQNTVRLPQKYQFVLTKHKINC